MFQACGGLCVFVRHPSLNQVRVDQNYRHPGFHPMAAVPYMTVRALYCQDETSAA